MRSSSPQTAKNERRENGMLGDPAPAARRFGWPRILLGAAVLIGICFIYIISLSGSGHHPPAGGAASPSSFETDPDPLGSVHCTAPYPSVSSGRIVQYALLIDAGSTGSRLHIYKFNNCGASPQYEYKVFKQTWPALSSYFEHPEAAGESLDVLLKEALRIVPEKLHSCTPIAVKATGGLRTLGTTKAEVILNAVRKRLTSEYPFPIHGGSRGVGIMDGAEAGAYTWVTANYLVGAIGGSSASSSVPVSSHAVLVLGVAPTQIVFEPAFGKDGKLEEGEHKYDLHFAGMNHTLYQHTYLGYGLMRARMHVHQLVDFMSSIRPTPPLTAGELLPQIPNPCLAQGTRQDVELVNARDAKRRYKVTMLGADVGGFEACNRIVELVMAKDAVCARKPCSFNGVYQPSLLQTFPTGKILLLSYFYDRLARLHSEEELAADLTVGTIAQDARDVCAGEGVWETRWGKDESAMEELRSQPEYCLDLTFMHALLRLGYELGAERPVRVAKQIDGTELDPWLGATLTMVAGELACRA
jgi:guanosine-diphosphatase